MQTYDLSAVTVLIVDPNAFMREILRELLDGLGVGRILTARSLENAADRLNGITIEGQSEEVSAILVELSQQRTQEDATDFSALIEREGDGRIRFHPQARRSAALAVLRAPDVPGVLFESGFVTNAADRARLTTDAGRREYAAALARAIRVYFARRTDTQED